MSTRHPIHASAHLQSLIDQGLIDFSPEVAAARAEGKPLVALESTIISHGMPYPQNVQTAREVEAIVRAHGAVPATIAVLDGKIRIGLNDEQLELLGQSPEAMKLSRRDLPFALSTGRVGATTVAATMICAQLAGIEVFVTGGIGGVHRGAETSFDISADLQELARTPVAVVCAGAKSILDLALTLEYLETHGVPVLSVGQENFAAFYTRDSGLKADFRIDGAADQARFLRTKWTLGLGGGAVISNPVPAEQAMPKARIDGYIAQALAEASEQGISGKAVTPYLLARIKDLSGGDSLVTNIALVKHNAVVGAALAKALREG
ncbi:MAG: pseudouridine-5'-phosphate glycosidase [Mitsuaria chitosanitabida]|uniref:pseudouridine-5'-phosphate glycosidase n=1 Tax=Roseateles chitosanitabidus TaxID=65048 RepID=UPI001AFF5F62|nr:pseudouridine-5'-phosphate glycosidase [Roseateles chitosanitabidus]